MRKDVRMGFAVGGVLLAVIIAAVLVLHHNKGRGNAVTLDTTGKSAGPANSDGSIDVAPPGQAAENKAPDNKSAPAERARQAPQKRSDDSAADSSTGGSDPWATLFATDGGSTKAQLRAPNPGPTQNEKRAESADQPVERGTARSTDNASDRGASTDAASPAPSSSDDAAPAGPKKSTTHRIASGETFVTIARAVYGDSRYFKAIVKANPNVNPERLKPGMLIQLPAASEVKQHSAAKESRSSSDSASAPSGRTALAADGKTYTVQERDSLYKISRKLYPSQPEKEGELFTLNKDLIGPDSSRLKPGMVLKLPEPVKTRAD